jgi:hypothetical protein
MSASIESWQAPQSSPAQHACVTACTVSAPASIAAFTSSSVTARQTQTYIQNLKPKDNEFRFQSPVER